MENINCDKSETNLYEELNIDRKQSVDSKQASQQENQLTNAETSKLSADQVALIKKEFDDLALYSEEEESDSQIIDKYYKLSNLAEKLDRNPKQFKELLRKRAQYISTKSESLDKFASALAVDTIISIFDDLRTNDISEIKDLPPSKKISIAKQCSDIKKALSGNSDLAIQVNNQNVITEEEARRFINANPHNTVSDIASEQNAGDDTASNE